MSIATMLQEMIDCYGSDDGYGPIDIIERAEAALKAEASALAPPTTSMANSLQELISGYYNDYQGMGANEILARATAAVLNANHEFVNMLRSLYNIDAWQLPELPPEHWLQFRTNPPRYLINLADKVQVDAILREVAKRQTQA